MLQISSSSHLPPWWVSVRWRQLHPRKSSVQPTVWLQGYEWWTGLHQWYKSPALLVLPWLLAAEWNADSLSVTWSHILCLMQRPTARARPGLSATAENALAWRGCVTSSVTAGIGQTSLWGNVVSTYRSRAAKIQIRFCFVHLWLTSVFVKSEEWILAEVQYLICWFGLWIPPETPQPIFHPNLQSWIIRRYIGIFYLIFSNTLTEAVIACFGGIL